MRRQYVWISEVTIACLLLIVFPTIVVGQAYVPTQPPAMGQYSTPTPRPAPGQLPPAQVQPPAVQQPQSSKYAFRPELSNPEYGHCLKLEKEWQQLWSNYYQWYETLRRMHPNDPRRSQLSYRLRDMKQRVDFSWEEFHKRCIYFPRPEEMRH